MTWPTRKSLTLLIVVSLFSLVIIYFLNKLSFSVGDYASLYFFSSLFQGNAALVTLTAMFLIFRRQSLDFAFDRLERILTDYIKSSVSMSLLFGNIFDLEIYNESAFAGLDQKKKDKAKGIMDSTAWKFWFAELKRINDSRSSLWKDGKNSIISIFTILIFSVILLPFSSNIHQYSYVELLILVIFILSELLSLIGLFRFVKKQLL